MGWKFVDKVDKLNFTGRTLILAIVETHYCESQEMMQSDNL